MQSSYLVKKRVVVATLIFRALAHLSSGLAEDTCNRQERRRRRRKEERIRRFKLNFTRSFHFADALYEHIHTLTQTDADRYAYKDTAKR